MEPIEKLRKNQIKAIKNSIDNDFESGIHFHCTGSGKSYIAIHLINEFHIKYPRSNIIWICERKSILIQQFSKEFIKKRNFNHILNQFHVLNYSENKQKSWTESVNSSIFWNKPLLLIINRAFLTSNQKYKNIKIKFNLIIHDECHTIKNKTTQEFYEHMTLDPQVRCIGFSATPNTDHSPLKKILTSYSIYDAFLDDIIVAPEIIWLKSNEILDDITIVKTVKTIINGLIYKKIIVWCGMIKNCLKMADLYSTHFSDYKICIDTSSKNKTKYYDYHEFEKFENMAILFCACKHREGSDILNLDGCIFLDKVNDRSSKLFIQSLGRVLRKDTKNLKTKGLIIDVKAESSSYLCGLINSYLNIKTPGTFPWTQSQYSEKIENKTVTVHTLTMIKPKPTNDFIKIINHSTVDLKTLFKREIPNEPKYCERLDYELQMIYKKNLTDQIIRAIDILNITKDIPHVTRGSCGSSLVCYLLGISHVDPVKYNIKFARFINEYRNTLPDIDLDFPHHLRDEVFLQIEKMWPGKVARISNHVFYHNKSALRQAIRNAGIHRFIGKNEIHQQLKKFDIETQNFIENEQKRLEDTFRYYSLHCGGIVYFEQGIPNELVLLDENKRKNIIPQIYMNKHDVSKNKNFKIDILSSRAISQLYEIYDGNNIDFENCEYDKATFDMLSRGENIGLTLAESPLMRKAFIKIKPKSIMDIAVCLSMIRPITKHKTFEDSEESDDLIDHIIFDDDAIEMISTEFNISDDDSDKYRRAFSKLDTEQINEFKLIIKDRTQEEQTHILNKLSVLTKYGFCKSHALSYAQLVYKLAYAKCHYPKRFWKATLNQSISHYKKWVHNYEAKSHGMILNESLKRDDISIYAENRKNKLENYDIYTQLKKYGYWSLRNLDFFPNCYLYNQEDKFHFSGIIASVKIKNNKHTNDNSKNISTLIGVEPHVYIQINIRSIPYFSPEWIGVTGAGIAETTLDKECKIITCDDYRFY